MGEGVEELLHVAHLARARRLGGFRVSREHQGRTHENLVFQRERGDPGAEIGGDSHAFLDRREDGCARLADKRQKDVLDGHRDSPCRSR